MRNPHIHWVDRGTGTPKDKDEGCSRLLFSGWSRTPRDGSGIVHDLVVETELPKVKKNGQFPDEPVRITV
jgi:hypothetical protein